jgi:hypothetical protein
MALVVGFGLVFLVVVVIDSLGYLTGVPHTSPLRVVGFLCIGVGLWLVIRGKL